MEPLKCSYCSSISIESLAALAENEFSAHSFPQHAYFEHHRSIQDLECSAKSGCELCKVILESCQRTPEQPGADVHGFSSPSNESMYSAALHTFPSDIKVCLNTSHVYGGDEIGKVKMWDTILIQIGKIPPPATLEGDEYEDTLDPVGLIIKAAPTNTYYINARRLGRLETDADLTSSTNFDIARSWLKFCEEEHSTCVSQSTAQLPTRVVDVGRADGLGRPRLFPSEGARAEYVALSHCWGGKVSVVLNSSNMEEFQNGLPLEALAQNFKDAILITRQLGYRYIWIDCLCIMQDSQSDWAIESSVMGKIYQNSAVTILAAACENSESGILANESIRRQPARATLPVGTGPAGNEFVTVESWTTRTWGEGQENMRNIAYDGSLSKRGWTLQEWCLSPRQLYYGKEMIYWRCQEQYKSSDESPKGFLFPDSDQYDALSAGLRSNEIWDQRKILHHEVESTLEEYQRLVQEYTSRSLTYASDKLPAFSGLSSRLHGVLDGDYLAGLWSCDLHNGLLWYKEMAWCKHVQPYRAPSWSWVVTDEKVLYMDRITKPSDLDLQVIEYHTIIKDKSNKYGEVVSALLVIEGLTKPLYRSKQSRFNYEGSVGHLYFDEPETSEDEQVFESLYAARTKDDDVHLMTMIHDDDFRPLNAEEEVLHDTMNWSLCSSQEYLALIVHVAEGTNSRGRIAYGLVLRPARNLEYNAYERIGLFTLDDSYPGWHQSWETTTLTLV